MPGDDTRESAETATGEEASEDPSDDGEQYHLEVAPATSPTACSSRGTQNGSRR